jgi:glycosyltransferase involved in cell wall biosynthesis
MKISLISEHASPLAVLGGVDAGGQNVHVAALSRALGDLGHEVVVHTRRDDPDLPASVPFGNGVTVEHVDAGPARVLPKDELLPHMEAFGDVLRERWAADRPDVVHAHFWMSGLAAMQAGRALDLPVLQTFHALGVVKRRHQGAADTSPAARATLEPGLARTVDHILATCSDEVFELRRLGAPRGRITVVPCGVDLTHFTPDGPAERRAGNGRLRVVAVSRLVPRKGLGDLVAGLAQAPDADLVVAGGPAQGSIDDDDEIRRLRVIAAEHGVLDRIEFRGRVEREDLPALLRSADVVACVPWYEPFGIVPLEAMACGVPVLATAVGGMIDSVVHDGTGWHVPPHEPGRIGEVLRHLGAHPETVARCGAEAARRAKGRYGWARVAQSTADTYARVLEGADAGRATTSGRAVRS